MKLQPLADRVVLKQLEAEETTKSGIVLPGKEKEKPQQAEVIAGGPSISCLTNKNCICSVSRITQSGLHFIACNRYKNTVRKVLILSLFYG